MKNLLLILLFVSTSVFSQTGPAGVGNATGANGQAENIIWLDASTLGLSDSDPVLSWPDLSGNGNDLIQLGTDNTPLFETNGLFSGTFNSVRFDGNERYLTLADNADLDASLSGVTIISVVYNATLDGSPRGIYSKRASSSSQESYSAFTYTGQRLNFDIRNSGDNRLASSASLNTTTDYIISTVYDGSLMEIFLQTEASGTRSTSGNINNSSSDLILGALNENYGTYFDGDIAELIFYRGDLNRAERLIIENYLSEKYNISITNDFFTSGDASYSNDLMGIGTADGTEKFSESGFSDALQISELNGSLNSTNEFVMFAHDNTAHAQGQTTDISVDPGVLDSHWARSWYVENSGDVSIQLRFDFGDAGLTYSGDPTDYVLLYRPNTSANYVRALVNSYASENGDQLVIDASNANLVTGYYTLGQGEQLVPGDIYSYQSGDWNDPLTWTTDPSGALRTPSGGLVPAADDNITILSGRTVTMDSDDNDGINITVDGELVVGNTSGHDFFNILGGGTISISGDVSNNDNFPSGTTTVFADSIVGGTVVIEGGAINLNQNRTYNNVLVNLSNTTNEATLLADYVINGNLTIARGTLKINDNSASVSRNITVYGTTQVNASGEIGVGTANARHEFNFYGDFNNSGRAEFTNRTTTDYNNEATDGIVDANFLSGLTNQEINCNGVTNFYRIEIDKGTDQTYILDINANLASNFNLYGPADYGHGSTAQLTTNDNALGLLRGTVRLNSNVDVPVLNNGGNYNISEAARLWVNGGSAEKPSGTAIVPYGTIQLSAGVINAPINSGITTRANGNIVVSDGVLTVNQIRTSVNGPENIGGYTQSGGTVNVTGNNIQTDYYVFSLTYPGNTFNMSGGTLRVAGARTGANTGGIFIASDEGNQSVTGGTVIMEINRNDDFKLTSLAPFWNVTMRYTSGTGAEVDLINGASGDGGNITNITDLDLRVLNNLVIESGITFDHNGFDVEIGSDFIIENGADYLYSSGKPNTTTLNGVDNSIMQFDNRTGDANDEQYFWNMTIDKPSGTTVTLLSGKSDVTGNENNLLRIEGDYFKLLSGTLDQGTHSVRLYADTLVNYDQLTVFDPLATNESDPNGKNDLLKLRDDGGTATIFITADTSRFGGLKLNSGSEIINLVSDVKIDFLEFKHGRMNLGTHNLTIDQLRVDLNGSETRTDEDGDGNFSVEDMFITAGNASDGGLSLYVNADGTNPGFIDMSGSANTTSNPTVFFFPLGTGTTGLDATSEYTPANIRFLSASDDGYVTVIPVTQKLATAGPYPLGNDISDRYWIVDYRDFTTVPKVERMWFRSVEKDDPNGGTDGFPANYIPGYVLENSPFTRTAEVEAGAPGSSGIDNNDAHNIRIFFWGNEGSGNPAGGFDLINAAYTAGDASKFVGAPQIFYSINSSQTNWTNGGAWSLTRDGSSAGDYPQDGDIAILTRDNGGAGDPSSYGAGVFVINNSTGPINVAKLIYDDYDPVNNNWISGCPRVIFDSNGSYNAYNSIFNEVEVTDRHIGGPTPNQSHGAVMQYNINASYTGIFPGGDFADFNNYSNALVIYAWDGGTGTATLSSDASEYPMLWFAGGNSSNRIMEFPDVDVTVNGRANLNGNMLIRVNNNSARTLTFKNNVEIGSGCCGQGFFEFDGNSTGNQTVIIEGDLSFNGSNGGQLRLVNNSAANTHNLTVYGDITIPGTGTMNLGDGSNSVIDLELSGVGTNTFTNSGSAILHRIIMNKGNSKDNSFSFNDSFTLNGTSNGATKAIEIQNGTLVLNDPLINVNLTSGGASFNIPASGGLQITAGQASVSGDDSGILLNGCLIIDGGTLDMDDAVGNGNNFIEYSASGNAVLQVSSGFLEVGSQIRPITTANTGVLKYRQTGGDVRIGTQSAPTSNRGMLQIYNIGSEFTFTGGTLTIERHQSAPSISALYLDPDIHDVTSEITIFNANTPAGQNDFRINSFIPLNDLTINGTNNPTASIRTTPLTIDGQLTISNGATFNGNGITLTVNGDFENNGVYDAQNNETIFNTDLTQEIRGSGTNNFFRFTKSGIGSLELTNTVTVNDLFTISEGTLNDNGFEIIINADAVVDGVHTSSGGNGLVFSGSANQELRRSAAGTGSIGGIRINNSNGVTIPDGNGYNFNISGDLQLNGGVFNVGGSNILFGATSDIIPVQPFSVSNMIRTNSSFVDKGVGKTFAANTTSDFTFPLGQAYYTPVIFDLSTNSNTSGTTTGSIFVSPANEYHPTIDDGNDLTAGGDINNVLQYYWALTAENITGLTSDVTFGYNDALVEAASGTEADYIAARILTFNNPTSLINKFTTNEVNETTNEIEFFFNGDDSNGISGDYFAGIDLAIPDNVATYTVDTDGSFTADVYDIAVPGGGAPTGSVVIVPSGFSLTLDQDDARFYRTIIQSGGVLEIDNTTNHRLGILDGTGDLRIISDGINANLPAFSGDFLSCAGGGLEYAGTGSYNILGGITSLRNLTLSGSGVRSFPNNNLTICENLVIDGPTANNSNNRNISVDNNLIINNGTFNTGTGNTTISNDFIVNGGTIDEQSNGSVTVENDLIIQGGNYISGSGGNLFLMGDLRYLSGTYLSGSGSHRIRLIGSVNQSISGNFTGSSKIYRLLVSNDAGVTITSGSVEIEDILFLNRGIINTNNNQFLLASSAQISPSIGKSNAYIDGRLFKVLNSSGQSFTFPIGDAGRWRPATINNVSVGGLTWEAEFKASGALSEPVVDNYDFTNPAEIATILKSEHWVISDGNVSTTGVSATVGLSWGAESDVSSVFAEREQTEVMIWNDALSSWDNLGGQNFSSGHTQSQGRFVASNSNIFSEHIYTLGSSDASNPLPVSLISFEGEKYGKSVKLEWKTSSELNNDYFEIEHSSDGYSFETLGIVKGHGTTTEEHTYTMYHERPEEGYNFYRLKQVDYDGAYSYEGQVVSVYFGSENKQILMVPFPNPTTADNLNVKVEINDGQALIELFDVLGNRQLTKVISNESLIGGELQMKVPEDIAPGIYIIKLRQGADTVVKRLMIKGR
ncbi:MAG: LamG-like jellyroll fold domain-containing protein [Fulvivirga sp.]